MSDQTATLCEHAVANETAKFPFHAARVLDVTIEIPFGGVGSFAARALPFAPVIPSFTANCSTMTIKGEYVSVSFAAVRAYVRFVRFWYPMLRSPVSNLLEDILRIQA